MNLPRPFTVLLGVALLFAAITPASGQSPSSQADQKSKLPAATPGQLPRWRGFNLPYRMRMEYRDRTHSQPFTEDKIRLIADLGFNFVRLPVDYRYWIKDGDWSKIDESAPLLAEIDNVIEWGLQYGVHVCINFHTAPGYCINDHSPEGSRLWADPVAQRICAMHWAYFARRYKGIPNDRLSFNLWNEPSRTDADTHLRVATKMVEAIRAEDRNRLIICDGFNFAPEPKLIDLEVAQSGRGYQPGQITHYQASWWDGSDRWGTPAWPLPQAHGWLHGIDSDHPTSGHELVIQGPFAETQQLRIRVGEVFNHAELVVRADDRVILRRDFATGPAGEGPWKSSVYHEEWNLYQCEYGQDVDVTIPAGTRAIGLKVEKGTWLQVTRLAIRADQLLEATVELETEWGTPASQLKFDTAENRWIAPEMRGRQWLWNDSVKPWLALSKQGVGVMIGEFGVYNRTPHDVTLAFLEDCLRNYQEAGFGWALWNLDGPFGILDSDRKDVDYEDFRGHKLDRKMLELLQRY